MRNCERHPDISALTTFRSKHQSHSDSQKAKHRHHQFNIVFSTFDSILGVLAAVFDQDLFQRLKCLDECIEKVRPHQIQLNDFSYAIDASSYCGHDCSVFGGNWSQSKNASMATQRFSIPNSSFGKTDTLLQHK